MIYGKISKITKTDGSTSSYTYDASGNRNSKTVVPATVGIGEVEWYVRDASGNVMSTYVTGDNKLNNGHLTQSEVYLYGSSRLGMQRPNIDVTVAQNNGINIVNGMAYTYEFTRGQKTFDLTDHRENVLTTVSDKKLQHTSDNATADYYLPDVTSASDYSVFGAINRSSNAGNVINAFNGQRRNTEISPTAQTAQFWEYNGDVGRRWNVDPKPNPSISIYVCFLNNPLLIQDIYGDTTRAVFDGKTGTMTIYGNTVENTNYIIVAQFKAHNRIASTSQGKWEDGAYEMSDKLNPTKHGNDKDKNGIKKDSRGGMYGIYGDYVAKDFTQTDNKKRSGMAIHSGRAKTKDEVGYNTMGCIRISEASMEKIADAIDIYGVFESITVINNLNRTDGKAVGIDFLNNQQIKPKQETPTVLKQTNSAEVRQSLFQRIGNFFSGFGIKVGIADAWNPTLSDEERRK